MRLFGTKKALFLAAIERCFERVTSTFREAAEAAEPSRRLQAMGDAYSARARRPRAAAVPAAGLRRRAAIPRSASSSAGATASCGEEVAELSGAGPQAVKAFFAVGMLLTVAAAIGVPELAEDNAWARELLS